MAISLKGKVALITGGTAGLGAAVARQLAAEGVDLALNYYSSVDRANTLAASIRSDFGVKVELLQGNVSEKAVTEKLVEETVEKLGKLDIVISNAGWTKIVPYENLDELDEEMWDNCYNSNVKAHFFLFKAAKKYLDQSEGGGTFIVSASVAGRMVFGSSIPYAVTKAALIHLVKMLAKSQGPKVRVHAVCPGLLMTDWGKRFSPEAVEKTKKLSPIGQIPDIDETASQYVLLTKLTTSTGTIVAMDGGISV
ncbi:uncharacterized protein RJT20DRAFT_131648 [Scheffersomyces xylosifermentans]|uniref:uncharacterized protein n=1 Tax=Scheffersomyces xylosifermentans TaxID=1304137 RepID=UPI00315DA7AE